MGGPPDASPDGANFVCISTDDPDSASTDSNCDGIDGVESDSIFVDGAAGEDSSIGSRSAPLATISAAIERASSSGKSSVLIARGTYPESIVLVEGIDLHGGYNPTTGWSRSLDSVDTHLHGSTSPTMLGADLAAPTRVSGLDIVGAYVVVAGASSIAIHLVDVTGLSFEDCEVHAGSAGAGVSSVMSSVQPLPGFPGVAGGAGTCIGNSGGCSPSNSTVAGRASVPARCDCGEGGGSKANVFSGDLALAGENGTFMSGALCSASAAQGSPSAGGLGNSGTGQNGQDGTTGTPGAAGSWTDAFSESGFATAFAGHGGVGGSGGGGGGGGAGSLRLCSNNFVLLGGTGGSGGGGGCGGVGGAGGQDGGASIGFYLWRSSVALRSVVIYRGFGGNGGDGALGRAGGPGGDPGSSTPNTTVYCDGLSPPSGGSGGRGGSGGTGGRGGGGAGGVSVAVLFGESSGLTPTTTNVFVSNEGSQGFGGRGGVPGPDGAFCAGYRIVDESCVSVLP